MSGLGIILLFILMTAIACLCVGLYYCELPMMFPVAGSIYSYAYVAFAEYIVAASADV